jgi:flagellar biosynthesis protein FlhF
MQTKTYFASSVPAALEVARQELGENAMLIGSRPAPAEVQRFGRLEVTFAHDAEPADQPLGETSELSDIRAQLAALRRAVGRSDRLSGNAQTALPREDVERIRVEPFAELAAGESRTLAFIGPPGRGKTTSLVKIAVKHGLARRVPVRIYSAGAHAIGGQEQMARYAAILGAPFQACESLASLHLALNGDGWKGLVLIDTPGLSTGDGAELDDLARFFAGHPEIEKHLVLRAEAGAAGMSRTISRFAALAPSRLLFTGLDEVDQPVSVAEALASSGIPATFCGTGQRIPEDLEQASAERLAPAMPAAPKLRRAAAA